MINYNKNKIELTEDGTYRPNKIIINDEVATMELYGEHHNGKNWRTSSNGNVLYYETESGKTYCIPQVILMGSK